MRRAAGGSHLQTKAPRGDDCRREMFTNAERMANAGDERGGGAASLCGLSNKQVHNPAFVCFAGCTREASALTLDLQPPPNHHPKLLIRL